MGILDDIFSSSNPAKYKAGSYANPGQPSPQQGGGLLDYFDKPGRMQTISSALMGAGQGMLQAPQNGGRFGQAMSGLAGMAGGMAQNKKKVEQEAMFEQLAGGDPLKLAFLKSNPEVGIKMMMEQKFAKPTATFSTVQNPYGHGGSAQKNSLTGENTGYQKAPTPAKQGNPIEVLDIASGKNVMIRPDNFNPTKHGSPKKDVSKPSKIQEFEYAKSQGYEGNFYDWSKETRGGTKVQVGSDGRFGSAPSGFAYVDDEASPAGVRLVQIPGGPKEAEAEGAEAKAAAATITKQRTADLVLEEIGTALNAVEESTFPSTGLVGSVLANIPGTDAADLGATLKTIKSNIGFDRLQRMRDESPTGGALGQVSTQEIQRLESILGNLEQSQSRDQFVRNLRRLNNVYMDIIHGDGIGPERMSLAARDSDSLLPKGIPNGSKPIGRTKNGNVVYQAPDGRRLVLE